MARITVEDCLERENNRFALVQLASKRTKQLLQGSPILSAEAKGNKAVVTALREIAEGHVRFMSEEDAAKIREKERLEAETKSHTELFVKPTNGALDLFEPIIDDADDDDDTDYVFDDADEEEVDDADDSDDEEKADDAEGDDADDEETPAEEPKDEE